MRRYLPLLALVCAAAAVPAWIQGQRQTPGAAAPAAAPITYQVTFPEPEHHWMQVEVTFANFGNDRWMRA